MRLSEKYQENPLFLLAVLRTIRPHLGKWIGDGEETGNRESARARAQAVSGSNEATIEMIEFNTHAVDFLLILIRHMIR